MRLLVWVKDVFFVFLLVSDQIKMDFVAVDIGAAQSILPSAIQLMREIALRVLITKVASDDLRAGKEKTAQTTHVTKHVPKGVD